MLKFLKASFTPNITSKDPNTSLIIKFLKLFKCFLVNSCLASIVFFGQLYVNDARKDPPKTRKIDATDIKCILALLL